MTSFDIISTWRNELDSQECITLSSYISKSLYSFRRKTNSLDAAKKYPEERSPVCYILSWLALCCVTEPNQVISLALSAVTPGALSIYIASNVEHAPRTVQCLDTILDIISRLCNAYPSVEDTRTTALSLQHAIVDYSWPHFHQKWRHISEFETGSKLSDGRPESLESLFSRSVDEWAKWCTQRGRPTNRTKALTLFAEHVKIDATRHDIVLKKVLRNLLQPFFNATTPEEKLIDFRDRSTLAYVLLKSDFYVKLHSWISSGVDPLVRLRRKLFRLAMFMRGAEALIDRGIPFFRDIAWGGNPNRRWTIHLVPRETGASDFKLIAPPRDHAKTLLSTLDLPEEERHEVEKRTFEDAWTIGQSVRLHVHSPASLGVYLASHQVPVLQDTLGMSKPPCTACASFISGLQSTWCTTGSTDKCAVDWMIPQDMEGIPVDEARRGIHLASKNCSSTIFMLFRNVATDRRIQTLMDQY